MHWFENNFNVYFEHFVICTWNEILSMAFLGFMIEFTEQIGH